MERFVRLTGVAAIIRRPNISTDAIIPSVWAVRSDIDLGAKLFANERYDANCNERSDFVLNRQPYRNAVVLIAGANFGCGSSRETAVWALQRFGIRCIIAPSFGEIFKENMFKNGMLPIELAEETIGILCSTMNESSLISVDLEQQMVRAAEGCEVRFTIGDGRRKALLEGLDDFGEVSACLAEITKFEIADRVSRQWAWAIDRTD